MGLNNRWIRRGAPETRRPIRRAPFEPALYSVDAFRLLRPKGEWQDGSIYTFTGPTIDGVTHNIAVTIDEKVKPDSVYDSPAQELDLVSRFSDTRHPLSGGN